MLPTLPVGKIVVGRHWFWKVRPNQIVVIRHKGIDKIKRIRAIRNNQVFVTGDNGQFSTDSREFGWLPLSDVIATVRVSRRHRLTAY